MAVGGGGHAVTFTVLKEAYCQSLPKVLVLKAHSDSSCRKRSHHRGQQLRQRKASVGETSTDLSSHDAPGSSVSARARGDDLCL